MKLNSLKIILGIIFIFLLTFMVTDDEFIIRNWKTWLLIYCALNIILGISIVYEKIIKNKK